MSLRHSSVFKSVYCVNITFILSEGKYFQHVKLAQSSLLNPKCFHLILHEDTNEKDKKCQDDLIAVVID